MPSARHSVIDPTPMLVAGTVPVEKLFFHNLDNLKPSTQPIKELKIAVGQILHPDKTVLAVEQNKVRFPLFFMDFIIINFNYAGPDATNIFSVHCLGLC